MEKYNYKAKLVRVVDGDTVDALINLASKNQLGLDINVLKATLETNNKVRKNRDWQQQKGRAVI